jgi:polyphosphate glucokinase
MSGTTGPLTLSFDIGGTHLKASVLGVDGTMVQAEQRVETPNPSPPDVVVPALVALGQKLGRCDRISIGFPGVVRQGTILTAPNLGTPAWASFALAAALSKALGKPARMLNDATVQGLGAIEGHGLECVITLGTGMGFSLFENGRPAPHLELSQHVAHKEKTYDQWIGDAALNRIGRKRWLRRVHRAIGQIATLVNYDTLLIGGGNARHIKFALPPNVRIVPNTAGITGGVKLWDPAVDSVFANDTAAAAA